MTLILKTENLNKVYRRGGLMGGKSISALNEVNITVESDKPAYTVVVDAALEAIAETRPASMADLARIKGIGPAKLDRFGPALLAVVAQHTSARSASPRG